MFAAAGLLNVQLDANSTAQDFAMRFLSKLFVGVSSSMKFGCEVTCVVEPAPPGTAKTPTPTS